MLIVDGAALAEAFFTRTRARSGAARSTRSQDARTAIESRSPTSAGEHRTLLATAIMAGGLRASELTGLRWRDVDLAGGWLHVNEAKTAAGIRRVDLAPDLLDMLKMWKADSRFSQPDDYVFPTTLGTRRERNTLRTRILYPAIRRANATLSTAGRSTIPEGVIFHSLRRTYARLMAESGADPRYTMRQIGHTRAEFTLAVYTEVGDRKHAANERLGSLLLGSDRALTGTSEPVAPSDSVSEVESTNEEGPHMQALSKWS
jgi:integrase